MSDCFDHMCDAYDQHYNFDGDDHMYGEDDNYYSRSNRSRRIGRPSNPLYYHTKIKFNNIERITTKAFLFNVEDHVGLWVPISWCKEMDEENNTVYIWTEGYKKNLAKAKREYNEQTGEYVD